MRCSSNHTTPFTSSATPRLDIPLRIIDVCHDAPWVISTKIDAASSYLTISYCILLYLTISINTTDYLTAPNWMKGKHTGSSELWKTTENTSNDGLSGCPPVLDVQLLKLLLGLFILGDACCCPNCLRLGGPNRPHIPKELGLSATPKTNWFIINFPSRDNHFGGTNPN